MTTVDPAALNTLIAQVAGGDQDAFAELYDCTVQQLLGIIHHFLPDPADAEEVTREAYVEIWQTAARLPEHSSPMHLLAAIAHRHATRRIHVP